MIATFGDARWRDLAWSRAYPSAHQQGFYDIVLRHEENGTLAGVRNRGALEEAEGDAFVFLDADDELAPGYLSAMAPWLRPRMVTTLPEDAAAYGDQPPHIVAPNLLSIYPDGHEVGPLHPNQGGWPRVNECVIGTLIGRKLFEKLGGFHEWPSIEDYDLWLRAWDAGAVIAHSPAVYRAHVNPEGLGRNVDQSCYAQIWAEHERRTGGRAAPPVGGYTA